MNLSCPISTTESVKIEISHGGGGEKTTELISKLFRPHFENEFLAQEHDGAIFTVASGRLAMTTDSFVVSPIFFPGGNIGDLAINGTVNDLLCCGAIPQYISCGFILEEGFEIEKLRVIAQTMGDAALKAGVKIIAGDTKVVEHGRGDGIYINTSGVGVVRENINLSPFNVQVGDRVIVTGEIGNHGVAILSKRDGLKFTTTIESDTAPLNDIVDNLLNHVPQTRVIRDATRGGVAGVLNEIARSAAVTIDVIETSLPINKSVESACSILGIDPLHIANEGLLVVVVPRECVEEALSAIREIEKGCNAMIIGSVSAISSGKVIMNLPLGQKRIIPVLSGEQLPRIC